MLFRTYNSFKEVDIEPRIGILYILTLEKEPICEHRIASGRGMLVQNTNHKRDKAFAVDRIQADLDERLFHLAMGFLETIRIDKSRYARD